MGRTCEVLCHRAFRSGGRDHHHGGCAMAKVAWRPLSRAVFLGLVDPT